MFKIFNNKPEIKPDSCSYATCNFCSMGCGLFLGIKDKEVIETTANPEHYVNQGEMCAIGKESWQIFKDKNRGRTPLLKNRKNENKIISFDHAFYKMRDVFQSMQKEYGFNSIGVIGGSSLALEEIYALGKIARLGLKTDYFNFNMPDSHYFETFGSDIMPASLNDIRTTQCLVVMGDDLSLYQPMMVKEILMAKEKNQAKLIVIGSKITELAKKADYFLNIPAFTEIVLLNTILNLLIKNGLIDLKMIESFTTGFADVKKVVRAYTPQAVAGFLNITEDKIISAANQIASSNATLFLWALGTEINPYLKEAINLMHTIALVTGNIGKPGASSLVIAPQGNINSVFLAGFAKTLPGNRDFSEENILKLSETLNIALEYMPKAPSKTVKEILEAAVAREVKVLWLIAADIISEFPDKKLVKEALESVDLLIVQDPFMNTLTGKYADIYLPSAIWGEKTATYLNFERRIGLTKKAVTPAGLAKTDREIILRFAKIMGYHNLVKNFASNKRIFEELKKVLKGTIFNMSELNYAKIKNANGIQIPWQKSQQKFSLSVEEMVNKSAKLSAVDYRQPMEEPDILFPFILRLEQERRPNFSLAANSKADNYVEVNPIDIKKLNLINGEMVEVSSKRGSLYLKLSASDKINTGEALILAQKDADIFNLLAFDKEVKENLQTVVSVEAVRRKRQTMVK